MDVGTYVFFFLFLIFNPTATFSTWKHEGGRLSVGSGSLTTPFLKSNYTNPVLLSGGASLSNGAAFTIEVMTQVNQNSFTTYLGTLQGESRTPRSENLYYLLGEGGEFYDDSFLGIFELGRVNVSTTWAPSSDAFPWTPTWTTVNFSVSFTTPPVVIAKITSLPDYPRYLVVRVQETTTKGFQVAIQPDSGMMNIPFSTHEVSWFAGTVGCFVINGSPFAIGRGTVSSLQSTVPFGCGFFPFPPTVVLFGIETYNDPEPVAARFSSPSVSGVNIVAAEDRAPPKTATDAQHGSESLAFLASFLQEPIELFANVNVSATLLQGSAGNWTYFRFPYHPVLASTFLFRIYQTTSTNNFNALTLYYAKDQYPGASSESSSQMFPGPMYQIQVVSPEIGWYYFGVQLSCCLGVSAKATIIPLLATVSGFNPTSSPTSGGGTLLIIGSYFANDTRVFIGSKECTNLTIQTNLFCTIPPGVGKDLPVKVASQSITQNAPNLFSYNPPTISFVFPTTMPTKGTNITLTGTNFGFIQNATATIDGNVSCPISFISSDGTTLVCELPARQESTHIVVTVGNQLTAPYELPYAPPQVSTLGPQQLPTAGGVDITLVGDNFGLSANVTVNGNKCDPISFQNHTYITCRLPPGQGIGVPVQVMVGSKSVTLTGPNGYSYAQPSLTSISPTHGNTSGGYDVQIHGTSLGVSDGTVYFGTRTCTIKNQSHSLINCTAPPGVGKVSIYALVGGQYSLNQLDFNYDAPIITNAFTAPLQGLTQGGTNLTVVGNNFGSSGSSSSISVQLNAIDCAPILERSDTQLICTLPSGQGSAQLILTVSGQPSNTYMYFYDPPAVSLISPASDWNTDGTTVITINGTNFGTTPSAITVYVLPINSPCQVDGSLNGVTHTMIKCTIPLGQGRPIALRVTVSGQEYTTPYIYSYASPQIDSISPQHGNTAGNYLLTISGKHFGTNANVTVGGQPCTTNGNSQTRIQCVVPAGQGVDQLVQVGVAGQLASYSSFSYDAPIITSISPGNGPTIGGINITLSGTNFGLKSNYSLFFVQSISEAAISNFNHTTIVFTLPNGSGKNHVPTLTVAGQTSTFTGANFTFNAPKWTSITGCPSSNGLGGTTQCSTVSPTIISFFGSNFGTDPSLVTVRVDGVNGNPCPVLPSPFNDTFLMCELQPRPTGGIDLVVAITVDGLVGTSPFKVGVSYTGPTIDPFPTILLTTTLGGETIHFTGSYLGLGPPLSVAIAVPNSVVLYQGTNAVFDGSNGVSFTTPAGVGQNLTLRVTVGLQTSPDSPGFVSYPTPQIIPNTIRIDPNLYPNENRYTGSFSEGDVVYFDVRNVGVDPQWLTVFYGPPGNATKYKCSSIQLLQLVPSTPENVTLRCVISAGSGDGHRFTVRAYNADVQGTDTYDYPEIPEIYSVEGCPGYDNATGVASLCPTTGGSLLTITGDHYGLNASALSVKIGNVDCRDVTYTTTKIWCTLPSGVGLNKAVVITSGQLFSLPAPMLSYAPPNITSVHGDPTCVNTGNTTIDCPRTGNVTITISGSNFGPNSTIYIGTKECTNVSHSPDQTSATCILPSGTGDNRQISLLQTNGQISNPGSLSYLKCAPGYYAPDGDINCYPCQPGTYSQLSGQTICANCEAGFYASDPATPRCLSCDPGKFASNPGSQNCSDCAEGTYTDASQQLFCKPCPVGTWNNETQQTQCNDCTMGYFQSSLNSLNCTPCAPGYYASSSRTVTCQPCEFGRFANATGMTTCTPCAAGTIAPSLASSTCSPCSAGKYAPLTGGGICSNCPLGSYSNSSAASTCTPCLPGFYSESNPSGSTKCLPCEAGYYQSENGKSLCSPCPVGRYSSGDPQGTVQCIACNAGEYSNSVGSTKCTLCAPGYYTSIGAQAVCSPCPAGTVAPGNGTSVCTKCNPGSYYGGSGGQVCIPCEIGFYEDHFAATVCLPCGPGLYAPTIGTEKCSVCSAGQRSEKSTGSSTCVNCTAGTANNAQQQYQCYACNPGFYAATSGLSSCLPCPDGTYAQDSGASGCTNCTIGTYRRGTTIQCASCPQGSYQSAEGQGSCISCPRGFFAPNPGATSCQACPLGQYALLSGAVACDDCLPGKFGNGSGLAACFDCPMGKYQDNPKSSFCVECGAGYYNDAEGRKSCYPCAPGTYSNITASTRCEFCSSGQFSSLSASTECTLCYPGSATDALGQTTCSACDYGFYTASEGSTSCSPCEIGTYSATTGAEKCTSCEVGKANGALGQSSCNFCALGMFGNRTALTACDNCEQGYYSSSRGMTTCTVCEAGKFSIGWGQSYCSACDPGFFGNTSGQSVCNTCDPGYYQPEAGQVHCLPCDKGLVAPNSGSILCSHCRAGYFGNDTHQSYCYACLPGFAQPLAGRPGCEPCPAGSASTAEGQSDCVKCGSRTISIANASSVCIACDQNSEPDLFHRSCLCNPTYYNVDGQRGVDLISYANVQCNKCPKGANCKGVGTAFRTMVSLPGWWRSNNESLQFYRCLREKDCPGGRSADQTCANHHTGPLCAVCIDGYQKSTSGDCTSCPSKRDSYLYFFLVFILALCLLCLQLYIILRSGKNLLARQAAIREEYLKSHSVPFPTRDRDNQDRSLKSALAGAPPPPPNFTYKLKVLLSFIQILTSISTNIEIVWPSKFKTFLSWFNPLNLDLLSISSFDCINRTSYYTRFIMWIVIPAVIIVLVFLFYLLPKYIHSIRKITVVSIHTTIAEERLFRRKEATQEGWKIIIFLLFLIYPTVSQVILRLYICEHVDTTYYLRSDMRYQCYTSEWDEYALIGYFMIALYPIGIPAFFLLLLWTNRTQLLDPGVEAKLGFLYAGYHHDVWWFEAVDMAHKLFLCALLGFVMVEHQLMAGILAIVSYLIIILLFRPYLRKGDDRLHLLAQVELFLYLLAGLMFRGEVTLDETTDIILSVVLIFLTCLFTLFFLIQAGKLLWKMFKGIRRTQSSKPEPATPLYKANSYRSDDDEDEEELDDRNNNRQHMNTNDYDYDDYDDHKSKLHSQNSRNGVPSRRPSDLHSELTRPDREGDRRNDDEPEDSVQQSMTRPRNGTMSNLDGSVTRRGPTTPRRGDGFTPRRGDGLSPRRGEQTPQTPQTEPESPRRDSASPRRESTSPRRGGGGPRRDTTVTESRSPRRLVFGGDDGDDPLQLSRSRRTTGTSSPPQTPLATHLSLKAALDVSNRIQEESQHSEEDDDDGDGDGGENAVRIVFSPERSPSSQSRSNSKPPALEGVEET